MSKKIIYICLSFCFAACGVDQMALNTQHHNIPSSQGITSDSQSDSGLEDEERTDRPYTDDHHPDVLGACCKPGLNSCADLMNFSDCNPANANYLWFPGDSCSDVNVIERCEPVHDEKVCCEIDGVPSTLSLSDCHAQGGNIVADDRCEPVHEEEGACCAPDSSGALWCIEVSSTDCHAQSGYFYGDGTSCTDSMVECPIQEEEDICCKDPNGNGPELATLSDCLAVGSSQVPDFYCEPVHEDTGACCNEDVPGGCIDNVTASDCEGAMFYPGDTCANLLANKICEPDDEDVCCELPGGPQIVPASYCDANGGVLPMSYCEPVEDDVCCELPGGYQILPASQCPAGYVVPDSYCEPHEDTGACCIWDNCSELTQNECEDQGGDYSGDGTSCSDVRCEEARPIDDNPTGSDGHEDNTSNGL
jgi:hypothetical protein